MINFITFNVTNSFMDANKMWGELQVDFGTFFKFIFKSLLLFLCYMLINPSSFIPFCSSYHAFYNPTTFHLIPITFLGRLKQNLDVFFVVLQKHSMNSYLFLYQTWGELIYHSSWKESWAYLNVIFSEIKCKDSSVETLFM